MTRTTGSFRVLNVGGEEVRSFQPRPLPPAEPPLVLDERLLALHNAALAAVGRLAVAGVMVPSPNWFLYGFVRKEAVISSQIEGTQATLKDVLTYEATHDADRLDDVREVCNYVDALAFARREIARPKGLPLSVRLLCAAHNRLMRGARGAEKQPGAIRTSQNWIGGTRPGNASFVPPPPDALPQELSELERWLYADDPLPPLVRAGLAHVQFETIHPFLDGNGRIGRLLIVLLLEHWGLLQSPLLYLSLAFKRHREEYYRCLSAVRAAGDWEGWTAYFLECVREAADDGIATATSLFALLNKDRQRLLRMRDATIPAVRLWDALPGRPIVTLSGAMSLLKTTKPTAAKAVATLCRANILRETTGRRRDRVYAYHAYLDVLTKDTDALP
ncbi:MAG TPA: Fic family protein [Pirellulales bacterium]|nr:Fic family protein [Pirellulales bacterium]